MLKQITRLILITSIYILSNQYVEAACEHKYFGNGNGTAASPYEVRNANDFDHIAQHNTLHYIQTANITTNKQWGSEGDGMRDGVNIVAFYGVYDGNNYTLTNTNTYKRYRSQSYWLSQAPLFEYLIGATVKNVTIISMANMGDGAYSRAEAALADSVESGSIILNCKLAIHDIQQAPASLVGDLSSGSQVINCGNVGYANSVVETMDDSDVLVQGCYNTGVLTSNVAGIVIRMYDGKITRCYNTGITGYPIPNRRGNAVLNEGIVGGIVSTVNQGVIEKNYSASQITAYQGTRVFPSDNYDLIDPNTAGGIVGTCDTPPYSGYSLIIRNNYSSSTINATRHSNAMQGNTNTCGGIVAKVHGILKLKEGVVDESKQEDLNYYNLNTTSTVEICNNYFVGVIQENGAVVNYNYRNTFNFFGKIIGVSNRRYVKIHDNHYLYNQNLQGTVLAETYLAFRWNPYDADYFNIAASNEGTTAQQDSFMRTSSFTTLMNANQTPMAWRDGDGSWPYPKFLGTNTIGIQASTPNKIGDNTSIMLNVNYVNEDCSNMIVKETSTGTVLYNGPITTNVSVPTGTLEGDLKFEAQLLLNSNAIVASSNVLDVNKKDILNNILAEGSNKTGLEKVFIVSDIDRYYENNSMNQSIVNQLKTKGIGVYLIGNTISDVLKPLLKP